jgi:cytochrome c biogenesis protein CcmG/thiol:disulfide interchange protein DsbE
MNWRRALLGVGIAIPIIALLAFGLTRDARLIPTALPGSPAPDFALAVLDPPGDTVRLAELRGHVVVLNFWASWCGPCRIEHPDLLAAARRYEPRGVRFFGLLYQDTPANALAWLRDLGEGYPSLLDDRTRTAIDYGISGIPETFVIDADGRVAHKFVGPVTLRQLADIIEPLLDRVPTPGEAP